MSELVRGLDCAVRAESCPLAVVIIDDGSRTQWPSDLQPTSLETVRSIRVLRLRRNLGHQRAIAIGLAWLEQHGAGDAVLVMDADGQDTADGAVQLIRAFKASDGETVIFAERRRRSESLLFQAGYHSYRWLHRGLTGLSVRVGNFSVLPARCLSTIVVLSELWNHYAAAVLRSRLNVEMVPIPRGRRIAGSGRMTVVDLTAHGLSAMSVFADIVGVRLIMAAVAASVLAAAAIAGVWLWPGVGRTPALVVTGTLMLMIFQLLTIATSFTFFMLSARRNMDFVPLRDYALFVASATTVWTS
jgi:hypothetical protein